MNLQTFTLPDVGEGLTEAEILDWRVAPGDDVVINQILVEIETAKAAVELPSPFAGRVTSLLVAPGQTVNVGVAIITIDSDPDGTAVAVTADAATDPAAETGTKIGEMTADGKIATLVGYVSAQASSARRPRKTSTSLGSAAPQVAAQAASQVASQAAPQVAVQAAPQVASQVASQENGGATAVAAAEPKPLAAPPVRMLAKTLGVNLATVTPTGAGGVITRHDVQTAVGPAVPPAVVPTRPAADVYDPATRQRRVPIKGVRRATAAAMVASAFTAPHVTVFNAVDVTEMMALRNRLKHRPEFADVKITPLTFAARAVCLAIARTPDVNAFWDETTREIVFQDYINLGIAAATPRGLVVPNIKDADAMDLHGLAAALTLLTETARAGKTSPASMAGGTFTLTNIGVFGVDAGTPILNPGESAILAVGSIKDTAWVVDGELAVRQVCQLSLSFDHRVIDGAQGSRFLADVSALMAEPGLALAW